MIDDRGPSQRWFDDFMSRWRPVSMREATSGLENDGPTCEDCGERPRARGSSVVSVRAARAKLCHRCYRKRHRGKSRGSRKPKKSPWVRCRLCKEGPVAGGDSQTSVQARRLGLCCRCYCSGGASKLKEMKA